MNGNQYMNNSKKVRICFAIFLAVTYGLFTPYIYHNDTKKYSFIILLLSGLILIYVLYKLSFGIKIKQRNFSDIISVILALSTLIGITVSLSLR